MFWAGMSSIATGSLMAIVGCMLVLMYVGAAVDVVRFGYRRTVIVTEEPEE
jgi:hypothetical protein